MAARKISNYFQPKEDVLASLRELVAPGDTVYTILRHRANSGMYRIIDLLVIKNDTPHRIGFQAAYVMGDPYDRDRDGIGVSGAGMDMGFHLVYNLSHVLYGDGYTCLGDRCPSNAHTNRDIPPLGVCSDHVKQHLGDCHNLECVPWVHKDGYALNHRWL